MEEKKKNHAHSSDNKDQKSEAREPKLLAAPKDNSLSYAEGDDPPVGSKFAKFNQPLATRHFVFSQILILISSLIFLGGVYWVLNNDNFQQTVVSTYSAVTANKVSFDLEVVSPDDELLIYTKELTISGKTSPKTAVLFAIQGSEIEFDAVESNIMGDFEKKIELQPGLNMLEISAFSNGNQKTVTRSVYYSEEILQ